MTTIVAPGRDVDFKPSIGAQTWEMSKRAIIALARQPALIIPSIVFPLFFLALGSSSFARAIDLPGFPAVNSYLDFGVAGAIMQGVLFGSITGATALATDIENGFFDRLIASPVARPSIIVGRLAGAMAFGATQTVFFLIVLLPFGLDVDGGLIGALMLTVSGTLIALCVGALMSMMALRTGSSEAVQGAFPLLFILLFFSSAFFPRQTMSGIYKDLAGYNPVSYIIEGMRDLVIEGVSAWAVVRAVVIPAALAVLTVLLAMRSLNNRIARG
ncbi:MAG: ABC transporter permease [Actinomycetota bacterium]